MANNKDDNIHAGHRERLLNLVYNAGFDKLSDIQALEFILCYIFPRGDVNPLAHRLLDRYRNLHTVLEASVDDLMSVKGMGRSSAMKLNLLLQVYDRYTQEKMGKNDKISTIGDIYDYLESTLRFKLDEELHILGMNAKGEMIADRKLAQGAVDTVSVQMREISYFITTHRISSAIIVHNHPGGGSLASMQDYETQQKLDRLFEFSSCTLIDNLIVGSGGIYSIKDGVLKRPFGDNTPQDAIKSIFNKK